MARGSARVVAIALVFAGLVFVGQTLDQVESRHADLAFLGLALVVLLHLALTIDAAWLLTAGLLSTMFAGHWDRLSLNASVGPHRVLLAAGLLAVLLRAPPVRDRPRLEFGAAHFAIAAALAYVVISAIFEGTLNHPIGRVALFDTFGVVPFAMFVVAPVAFVTERQRNILLGGLVAAGVYLSISAVLEKLELYELVFPGYIGDPSVGSHFGRARGPFAEAVAMGVSLVVCASAAAVAFFRWKEPLPRLVAGFVVVAAPFGLLFTLTRGAWLAAVVGTFVALATTAGLRRYVPPVAAAGTVLVVLAFALIPGVADEVRDRQNDRAPIYERQNTTAAGLRMVADRPFVGHGWWFAADEMTPFYRLHPDIPLTGARAGLHNVYLLYAVALGLVGLGLWAVAVATVFGRALSVRGPPELVAWQIGLKAAVAAWLVIGIFGPANYAFPTAVVWTWAGLIWPAWRAPSEAADGPTARTAAST